MYSHRPYQMLSLSGVETPREIIISDDEKPVHFSETNDCGLNKMDKDGYLLDDFSNTPLLAPYVIVGKDKCMNCSTVFTRENFKKIVKNLGFFLTTTKSGGILDMRVDDIINSAKVCGKQGDLQKIKMWVEELYPLIEWDDNKESKEKSRSNQVIYDRMPPAVLRAAQHRGTVLNERMAVIGTVATFDENAVEDISIVDDRLVIKSFSEIHVSLLTAPRHRFIVFILLVMIFLTGSILVGGTSVVSGQQWWGQTHKPGFDEATGMPGQAKKNEEETRQREQREKKEREQREKKEREQREKEERAQRERNERALKKKHCQQLLTDYSLNNLIPATCKGRIRDAVKDLHPDKLESKDPGALVALQGCMSNEYGNDKRLSHQCRRMLSM